MLAVPPSGSSASDSGISQSDKKVPGTIELMLTFIECRTGFTVKYGDIDSRYYSSLSSILRAMADLVCFEGLDSYPASAIAFRISAQALNASAEAMAILFA